MYTNQMQTTQLTFEEENVEMSRRDSGHPDTHMMHLRLCRLEQRILQLKMWILYVIIAVQFALLAFCCIHRLVCVAPGSK